MDILSAIFDIVRVSILTLFSLIFSPKKHPSRAWLSEFTFRLAKRLVAESVGKPIPWLRQRQHLLKLVTPEMFKISKYKINIEGVPCLVIEPTSTVTERRTILYIHGGGYCVGSADGYLPTMAKIAVKCHAKVIGIDYRLCPEHPIPAAQEDCVKVTEYFVQSRIAQNRIVQNNKDQSLILMGDSAGGALCLETLNALANAGIEKEVDAAVLISPWLEPLENNILELANEHSDILDQAIANHWKQNFYNNSEQEVFVSLGSINSKKLPKLYIQAAGAEVFIKQINEFADRLKGQNHDLRYEVFEGQFHVFQTFAPLVREADQALNKVATYVLDELR